MQAGEQLEGVDIKHEVNTQQSKGQIQRTYYFISKVKPKAK